MDADPILAAFTRPGGGADLETVRGLVPDPRFDPHAAAGLVVTLHRDALVAILKRRLAALYAADPELAQVVPLAGRAAEAQRLRATLRDLEVREELVIARAEALGQVIDRREDVDPAALFDPRVFEEPGPSAA